MTHDTAPSCASMHLLAGERISWGSRLPFVGAALALHLVVFALSFPELAAPLPEAPRETGCELVVHKWTAPPPRIESRRPPEALLEERIAVPDPLFESLEPILDPEVAELPVEFDDVDFVEPAHTAAPAPAPRPLIAGTLGVGVPRAIEETRVQPVYPEIARRAGVSGRVVLRAVVTRRGEVSEIETLDESPAGFGFGERAREALRQWRYEPARLAGRPVDVSMSVVVRFSLDREPG